MGSDLKKIKKYYGEDMMHLCRELFPTILEEEGALLGIIEATFPHSRYLYDDIIKDNQVTTFKDFIYDKYNIQDSGEEETESFISPFDLMDQAGYTLYECHTEDDIQKFRKYYAKDEELCTFAGGRLNTSIVFFAVKKNVDEIKRECFTNPERQDEYGTSVISIQFRRGEKNTLSIKNRYNHTVDNPDATFGNNLDNIIEGLNDSFESAYNLVHTGGHEKFELSKYVRATDGKYYKYNLEVNEIYYGPDNIVIENHEVLSKYQEREKYLVIDNIIIDLVNKKILTYDNSDKYIENLNDISKIEVIRISDTSKKRIILMMNNGSKVIFEVDRYNRIISLYDDFTIEIPDDSLPHISHIKTLTMPKLTVCGNNFLLGYSILNKVEMPEVNYIGDNFLRYNNKLREIDFPNLKTVGNCFIRGNDMIKRISFPNLEAVGDDFMDLNRYIDAIYMPKVKLVGDWFLSNNIKISVLEMPLLEKVGSSFLYNNKSLKSISLPNLTSVDNCFLYSTMVTDLNLPNLIQAGNHFMAENIIIEKISLPNLVKVGNYFLNSNRVINSINLPNLVLAGDAFLRSNEELKEIFLPNLELCGIDFMMYNHSLEMINLPKIQYVGDGFLIFNYKLRKQALVDMEEIPTENGKKYVRKR